MSQTSSPDTSRAWPKMKSLPSSLKQFLGIEGRADEAVLEAVREMNAIADRIEERTDTVRKQADGETERVRGRARRD